MTLSFRGDFNCRVKISTTYTPIKPIKAPYKQTAWISMTFSTSTSMQKRGLLVVHCAGDKLTNTYRCKQPVGQLTTPPSPVGRCSLLLVLGNGPLPSQTTGGAMVSCYTCKPLGVKGTRRNEKGLATFSKRRVPISIAWDPVEIPRQEYV